jgi:5-methylcytosine-specific restriction protein A
MIMTRDAGLCQPCQAAGRVTIAAQVDHIVPKARGGTDDPGNLQAICRQCHQAKTDREKNEGRHG